MTGIHRAMRQTSRAFVMPEPLAGDSRMPHDREGSLRIFTERHRHHHADCAR